MISFFLICVSLYWLPTIIGAVRHSPSLMAIAVLNFFLGWTILGWIIALVWSLAAVPREIVVRVEHSDLSR